VPAKSATLLTAMHRCHSIAYGAGRARRSLAAHHMGAELDRGVEQMSMNAGARLGPYEILAALGAGGMGEVFRARDDAAVPLLSIRVPCGGGQVLDLGPSGCPAHQRDACAASQPDHSRLRCSKSINPW
jgi:hypothetical protein